MLAPMTMPMLTSLVFTNYIFALLWGSVNSAGNSRQFKPKFDQKNKKGEAVSGPRLESSTKSFVAIA